MEYIYVVHDETTGQEYYCAGLIVALRWVRHEMTAQGVADVNEVLSGENLLQVREFFKDNHVGSYCWSSEGFAIHKREVYHS